MGEILQNLFDSEFYLNSADYKKFGMSIGHITSAILFVNPADFLLWTPRHSHIAMGTSKTHKVPSRFFKEGKAKANGQVTLLEAVAGALPDLDFGIESTPIPTKISISERQRRDAIMQMKPLLKSSDKDMPLVERLRKTIPAEMEKRK